MLRFWVVGHFASTARLQYSHHNIIVYLCRIYLFIYDLFDTGWTVMQIYEYNLTWLGPISENKIVKN
jgi:hypothetical protein